MINSNAIKKYFLYAVGEILLVVIGILIALQINNLNENRKKQIHENETAQELIRELDQNLKFTEDEIIYNDGRIDSIKNLLNFISSDPTAGSYEKFNDLLNAALSFNEYAPIISKTRKILSLDNFSFTQSDSLNILLPDYLSSIERVNEYYQYNVDSWKMINLPFVIEYFPLRNFDWLPEDVRESNHKVDHLELMKSRKFESLISNTLADTYGYYKRLLENKELILKLIAQLKKDYL
jgi:hypothetical protein